MVGTGSASAAAGPTLAMVAREAGVSVPTASKVVNGRKDVAPETRRRVTEALNRLGYVRRSRFEAAGPPRLVDLVLESLDGPGSGPVLRGVAEAAHEAGLEVVVSAVPDGTASGRAEHAWLDRAAARGSCGVLFHLPGLSPSQHSWLTRRRLPYVLIDPAHQPPPGVVSVGAADGQGAVTATEHLLALGHERIAVLAGRPGTVHGDARVAGYRSALAAAGVRQHAEYVRHAGPDGTGARLCTLELLDLPEPPTAVFACSDRMALGIHEALAERGLRAPDDLSVVGFGDLPEARWAVPALTTVHRPLAEMATTALRLLVRLTRGERLAGTRTELPTRLVPRTSTATRPGPGR
ncbi:LacI family DNA-binding transcriptional regulator [Streptomyces sp. MMS24-I2-30]|uniref:LacI family DNA-binding transcriptional regulator n=1 Tax=Streptomyces sp. MMS24-I2-30 TaxID=3351564 RepID=UPI0038969A10